MNAGRSNPTALRPIRRAAAVIAGTTLACFMLHQSACDTGQPPELPEHSQAPQWPDEPLQPLQPNQTGPEAPDVAPTPIVSPIDHRPSEPIALAPPPSPSLSLKERFSPGARFRRDVQINRDFRVEVQSGLAATVQGTIERHRAYTVEVEDSVGGQIVSATITIEQDERGAAPAGRRLAMRATESALVGTSLHCQLTGDGGYQCDAPGLDAPGLNPTERDLYGILPQRAAMLPGRPATAGHTWDVDGRDAELFLDTSGADAVVHFTFDDADAVHRDTPSYHVSYTFEGSQPIQLSGQTLSATMSGTGEYYYSQAQSAVLHHRQERLVQFSGPVIRGGRTTPMERSETIIFIEETDLAPH